MFSPKNNCIKASTKCVKGKNLDFQMIAEQRFVPEIPHILIENKKLQRNCLKKEMTRL
jgi:hypothetical protein